MRKRCHQNWLAENGGICASSPCGLTGRGMRQLAKVMVVGGEQPGAYFTVMH